MEISDIKQEPEEEQWDYKFSADANSYIKIEHTDEPDYVVISKDQPHLSDQGSKKETDFISIKNDENTSNVPFKIKSELKSEELDLKDEVVVKSEEEDKADVQKNTLKLECAPSISGINNVGFLDKKMTNNYVALELKDDMCRIIDALNDERFEIKMELEECSPKLEDEIRNLINDGYRIKDVKRYEDKDVKRYEDKIKLSKGVKIADSFPNIDINARSFSSSETVNSNKAKFNQLISDYKCIYCFYQYKHQKRLIQHYKEIHQIDFGPKGSCEYQNVGKPKESKCNYCSYKSRNKHLLSRHERLHLSPEETSNIKCDKCGYCTNHKNNLNQHVKCHQSSNRGRKKKKSNIHTNNEQTSNTFQCFHCSYKSINRSNFIQHTKSHMISKIAEQDYIFRCDICDYKTRKKHHIPKHLLVHRRQQTS